MNAARLRGWKHPDRKLPSFGGRLDRLHFRNQSCGLDGTCADHAASQELARTSVSSVFGARTFFGRAKPVEIYLHLSRHDSERLGLYCCIAVSAFAGFAVTCCGVASSERSQPPPSASISETECVMRWISIDARAC